jgi:hypothetical protein
MEEDIVDGFFWVYGFNKDCVMKKRREEKGKKRKKKWSKEKSSKKERKKVKYDWPVVINYLLFSQADVTILTKLSRATYFLKQYCAIEAKNKKPCQKKNVQK